MPRSMVGFDENEKEKPQPIYYANDVTCAADVHIMWIGVFKEVKNVADARTERVC